MCVSLNSAYLGSLRCGYQGCCWCTYSLVEIVVFLVLLFTRLSFGCVISYFDNTTCYTYRGYPPPLQMHQSSCPTLVQSVTLTCACGRKEKVGQSVVIVEKAHLWLNL